MNHEELTNQILAAWHRHNDILLYLLNEISKEGLLAKPTGSRGRDVAHQFAHLNRVRLGWLHYHATGKRPKLERFEKGEIISKTHLRKALQESGKEVANFLNQALSGKIRPKLFGKNAIRWMSYLIAHESHHRGQILLALKQTGIRIPEKVAVQGIWGKWIFGK